MKKIIALYFVLLQLIPNVLSAQKPERQISFARESKPHTYYVAQAETWWKEIQKNDSSEYNWYNYFRACRNAHGTADWRSDFINESPYLKTGDSIMSLIKEHIPGTFTFYYLSYLSQGIGTDNKENLFKAYSMNPDFEGIHSSMISYAESALDTTLRKKVNKEWYKTNYLSEQLLNYAYNVLMSLDSNAILFTVSDNDTYPLWLLQDALNIRADVWVINIDFFLLDDYRKEVYKRLHIPEQRLGKIDLDEYHSNWKKALSHVLTNYKGPKQVYLGMTVASEFYKDFEHQLYPIGLAFKFSKVKPDVDKLNKKLYEQVFMLDYLHHYFSYDLNQANVDNQNLNYLYCFENVYKQYKAEKRTADAKKLKDLSLLLAKRLGRKEYVDWVEKEFN